MDGRYTNGQYTQPLPPGYSTPEHSNYYNPPLVHNEQGYPASKSSSLVTPPPPPPPPPNSFPNIGPLPSGANAAFYPPPVQQQQNQYQSPSSNGSTFMEQPGLSRHVSTNQMTVVGIRSPDSNGYSSNNPPPPPLTYPQQQSPGSGSFTAQINGSPSPSASYSQLAVNGQSYISPPSSGYGPPPLNMNMNYSSYPPPSVQQYGNNNNNNYINNNNNNNNNSNNYPPPLYSGHIGPPTIQTANVGVAGTYPTDSPFYGSPGYTPISPGPNSLDSNVSPLRSNSMDPQNLPPSPSGRQRQGGNMKRVNSRIDPSQMPRPIRPVDGLVYQTNSGTTTSSGRKIPPTSCVHFRVVDTGNCSPRCLRITSTAPPATKEIANMTGIPIAITATPFALPEGSEELVPLVDAGENPPRCSRCRGYVNVHVIWSDGGNKWTCNLCSMVNTTPSYYYSALDGVGLRLDRKQRPELTHGTVDFLVGKDFSIRPVQEPIYIYAIDISQRAVATGLTTAALAAVRAAIPYLQGPQERIRVGILTFDRAIQFYHVKEDSTSDPVRVLISDSDDPVPALPHDVWVLSLVASGTAISKLLDKIPELIPALQGYDRDGNMTRSHPAANGIASATSSNIPYDEYAQTCPSAVIKVVQQSLSSIGGKLFLFTSFSSNIGFGRVTTAAARDTQNIYGTPAELGSYTTATTAMATADARKASADERATLAAYIDLAASCSKSFVSVDVIVASESDHLFPDYALLSEVSEQTGGNFHVFSGSLLLEDNIIRMQQQLLSIQQSMAGFEVMMKLRCSTGFRVERVYGRGCYDEGVNELEVAAINTSSTYCCILKHDAALKDDDKVYIQLAVLYTSAAATRRCVRVHNLVTTATTTAQQVFRHADLDATVDVIMKLAIDKALRFPLSAEKEGPRIFLTETAIEILQKYRTHCSPDSSRGQLILPESLKLLPLYTLCALKHPALLDNFPGGSDGAKGIAAGRGAPIQVRGHERAYELRRLRSLPASQMMNSLYPRLFMLHQLEDGDGEPYQLLEGLVITKMPPVVPTISEVLESEGMYLLDDGGTLWLHIGRSVAPHKLEEWFGLSISPSGIYEKSKNLSFNVGGSYEASKLAAIVQNLRQNNWNKQELKVIWAGEQTGPDSVRFSLRLIEDSIYGNASYVDFLCKIHTKIQNKAT